MKKLKNLTFQPIRIIINNSEIRIPPRETIEVNEITNDMLVIERRGLIKIRDVR